MWLISLIYLSNTLLGVQDFLDHYWQRPLPAQGTPPATLSSLETALEPQACQKCHPTQFAQWQQSRHARAMGAGVIGQLLDMTEEEQQSCLNCHAPLAEQLESLKTPPPPKDQAQPLHQPLHQQGVICSACHIRHYQWFGPPRRPELPPLTTAQPLPHHGWQSQPAFTDSQFCAACHQFPEDGYALNGKLLENTYNEWQKSSQAQQGKTCQSCHTPNRQHLWRGIHDAEMVLSGVEIQHSQAILHQQRVQATLSLKNTGVGHLLPTYVTPRIILEGYQEMPDGKQVEESVQRQIIAREVNLDLTIEEFDTRLAPQQMTTFQYCAPLVPPATKLVLQIIVEPEAFYTRFYRFLLDKQLPNHGTSFIRQAVEESEATRFVLYKVELELRVRE